VSGRVLGAIEPTCLFHIGPAAPFMSLPRR
jgi:hypothetical protein